MEENITKRGPTTDTFGIGMLPLDMGYLPEVFRRKGEIEINNTQSVRERSLRELKAAIASEDIVFSKIPFSDELLLCFLTCRKFDVGRVLAQLKKFSIFKGKHDLMFTLAPFEVLAEFQTSEFATFLPWRCQDGCAIALLQIGKLNSKQHPVDVIKQFTALSLVQSLRDPMAQVNGYKVILDLNITVEALKICTPENIHTLYYGTQVALPVRFKQIHFVNMNPVGRIIWQVLSLFLSKKLRQRVRFHPVHDTLLDFFPRAVLPVKYGGDLKDYVMPDWLRKISSPEEMKWVTGSIYDEIKK